MTPESFKEFRNHIGMSQTAIGKWLGTESRPYSLRAVQSWESGERKIPPAVERLINLGTVMPS